MKIKPLAPKALLYRAARFIAIRANEIKTSEIISPERVREIACRIWENDWSPYSLLTHTYLTLREVPLEVSGGFLYGPSKEHFLEHNERTPLGVWVDELPGWLGLSYTILHYMVFSGIWLIVAPLLGGVKLLLMITTKKWGDL